MRERRRNADGGFHLANKNNNIMPWLVNSNTSCAVVMIICVSGVVAAKHHRMMDTVKADDKDKPWTNFSAAATSFWMQPQDLR